MAHYYERNIYMIIESDNSDAFCDVSILAERSRDRTSDGVVLGRGVVKPYTMLES